MGTLGNKGKVIRPGEAAAICGVHRDTVAEWADQELISCMRTLGGHRRYFEREVKRYNKKRRARLARGAKA